MSQEKKYSAREAAIAVLKKAHEVLMKAEAAKDDTPPDTVQKEDPDAVPRNGNVTLGDKVNAVVEQHLAENKPEEKKEEEHDEKLKGHIRLAKFMGHIESKRKGRTDEKPELEKGELEKCGELEKEEPTGVHEPMGDKDSKMKGQSRTGVMHALNHGMKAEGKKPFKHDAKADHKAKLAELKAMPKPNLTKDEGDDGEE